VECATTNCNWLCTGAEVFPAMLAAIESARESIRLETYIYAADSLGQRFRDALIKAQQRGTKVQVLYDALGSLNLPGSFFDPFRQAGGEARCFNATLLSRFGVRDHRKVLVCDRQIAFVGGFNIAAEYDGDGVTSGWLDVGLKIEGPLAMELAASFDQMFHLALTPQRLSVRLQRSRAKKTIRASHEQLLLSGPGRGRSPIKNALKRDFARARKVQIVMAYFLPTWRIRRALVRVARSGGTVELVLAGKSDVALAQLAGQSLYRRFLRAGVKIFEYEPQILHMKLIVIDGVVYVGSANLDQRSLKINYELMVRFENQSMAAEAADLFNRTKAHSREITFGEWKSRSLWQRIKQRWAYFLLVRMDPRIARLRS
jgi:cardiolipin synthase